MFDISGCRYLLAYTTDVVSTSIPNWNDFSHRNWIDNYWQLLWHDTRGCVDSIIKLETARPWKCLHRGEGQVLSTLGRGWETRLVAKGVSSVCSSAHFAILLHDHIRGLQIRQLPLFSHFHGFLSSWFCLNRPSVQFGFISIFIQSNKNDTILHYNNQRKIHKTTHYGGISWAADKGL